VSQGPGAGPETKGKDTAMNHPGTDQTISNITMPAGSADAFDGFLLESEDDDYLDRRVFDLRESLADYRNL
jgi:hypothetical protein